jgi:DNA-binding IscR family transcriptional regulator
MAGLRDAGLVRSTPGHGGGWMLTRATNEISLRDVYLALGETMLLKLGTVESQGCLVEQAISALMEDFRRQAEALLGNRLGETTLADVSAAVNQMMKKRKDRRLLHVV